MKQMESENLSKSPADAQCTVTLSQRGALRVHVRRDIVAHLLSPLFVLLS